MNKLIIPNGGMPLYGDDFGFLDAANRDALKGIVFEFARQSGGSLVLGGCELSIAGPTVTVTAGYVLIGYEVCHFPGTSFPLATASGGHLAIDVYFDPSGLKSFANSSTQDTYQVRRAKFNATNDVVDGPLDFNSPDLVRLPKALADVIATQFVSSSAITHFNGWSAEPGNNPIVRRQMKRGFLYGGLQVGTISQLTFTHVATLPAGFRPLNRFKAICAAFGTGIFGNVMVEFFTNGEIYAIATSGDAWDLVSLNVPFLTA